MELTAIYKIQGAKPSSPFAGETVRIRGVVTGMAKRGFFIQDPDTTANPPADSIACSHAIFVYMRGQKPPVNCLLELQAEVVDYFKNDNDKPVTQLHMLDADLIDKDAPPVTAYPLSSQLLFEHQHRLAEFLNSLEGMLVSLDAGATFVQPSNPFGDYVVLLADCDLKQHYAGAIAAKHGGIILGYKDFEHWLPSFRIVIAANAPQLNVGAKLLSKVTGPLNYRSGSYQLAVSHAIEVDNQSVAESKTSFEPSLNAMTVMTLNCLNLDPKIESASLVKNPDLDIDDDIGSGQFRLLARSIVEQANSPDIVALQEIQDSDGAEQTTTVDAEKTYQVLIAAVQRLGGPQYDWADIPPSLDADGGQPGGNIRNGFLYNPQRVSLNKQSLQRLGETADVFEGSRKPLMASFKSIKTTQQLTIINVHLASKRHQNSVFSVLDAAFDPREDMRVGQAELIYRQLNTLAKKEIDYYVTGDFNDLADSPTLNSLLGEGNSNLVDLLPENERYDYNHRGKLHVLMHGIVNKKLVAEKRAEYEILHGNELLGVNVGQMSGKASDHAYVIARILK